ncbi:MAG: host-nuclease inhibitor Gam family protein [Oscillospiraceae bacterium]|nr:host-nuclease inhibitor Gam family protein [Oscillospiraceae bacterium]
MDYIDDLYMETASEGEDEGFTIDTDDKAEWAVRKIKATMDDAQRRADLCDREIARYTAEKARILKSAEDGTAFLRAHLRAYFEAHGERHKVTKAGTRKYALISGTLVLKAQQPDIERDEDALIAWAALNEPELVRTEKHVAWGELKKRCHAEGTSMVLDETGEVLPGVTVTPKAPVFQVEVK